tara:strand:- start:199 stop:1467 length:1269 start_codon:yes stop_codon:yes gene_type:complete
MINEGSLRDWFGKSKSKDGKPGWVQSDGSPCANEPGETKTPKCYSSAKRASMSKKELRSADARKSRQDPNQQQKTGAAKPTYVSTDKPKKKMKEEMEVNEAKDKPGKGSGTKDACYHKVKSRYSVWPSAYASGALVKCRRVGAANWGNSTKKEEYMALPEFSDMQIRAMRSAGIEVEVIDEKCWKGYEKKGMKTMFGKRYPNCVKKEEAEVTQEGKADGDPCWDTHKQVGMKKKGGKMVPNCVPKNEEVELTYESVTLEESIRIPAESGNIYDVMFNWRGKFKYMKVFFPEIKRPSRDEVEVAINKIYPGAKVSRYDVSTVGQGDSYLNVGKSDVYAEFDEGAAWTKKSGKNPSGGLNEKGRKSYERENPGSDLKAPSKKVGNKRRASFCARMKGMKKKLTSKKTASDPDSRINKSLRAWNC